MEEKESRSNVEDGPLSGLAVVVVVLSVIALTLFLAVAYVYNLLLS